MSIPVGDSTLQVKNPECSPRNQKTSGFPIKHRVINSRDENTCNPIPLMELVRLSGYITFLAKQLDLQQSKGSHFTFVYITSARPSTMQFYYPLTGFSRENESSEPDLPEIFTVGDENEKYRFKAIPIRWRAIDHHSLILKDRDILLPPARDLCGPSDLLHNFLGN